MYQSLPNTRVPSNSFDCSYDVKLSLDMGYCVPVGLMEVIPGDQVSMGTQLLARMAPMVHPVMHKFDIDIHHFFVNNRIVWDRWEKFASPNYVSKTGSAPAHPYFAGVSIAPNSLGDYLGLPTSVQLDKVNAIPFAVYQIICQDYYIDQDLGSANSPGEETDTVVDWKLEDGLNEFNGTGKYYGMLVRRSWGQDYFTSCRPWPQKGDAVTLPIGLNAPVIRTNTGLPSLLTTVDGSSVASGPVSASNANTPSGAITVGGKNMQLDPNGQLITDLTEAGQVTINALRWAEALQVFLEKNARGGTRYNEMVEEHFDVRNPDQRVQRAEFLGGSTQPIVISEVLQSSQTTTEEGQAANPSPLGTQAGHGISVAGGNNFSYFCTEHGFIMSIVSVRPKTGYQQGLHKMWSRFDLFDYPWPSLANLGEQEVYNKELYYALDGQNEGVFGYQPRYEELRYGFNRTCGDFRTNLNKFHANRIFNNRPALNWQFLECKPDDRIFAVSDPLNPNAVQNIYMHAIHGITIRRRLPKRGIPTL